MQNRTGYRNQVTSQVNLLYGLLALAILIAILGVINTLPCRPPATDSVRQRRVRFSARLTALVARTIREPSPFLRRHRSRARHPAIRPGAARSHARTRHPVTGVAAHKHTLANHGGPEAFSTTIWTVFAARGAEQRIRRLLAIPGHTDLNQAAKHLGIRKAVLTHQIRQLEHAVGTTLLEIGRGSRGITLTPAGEKFTREIHPVLAMLDSDRHR